MPDKTHIYCIPRTLGLAALLSSSVSIRGTVARSISTVSAASSLVSDFLSDCSAVSRAEVRADSGNVLGKVDFMGQEGGLSCC